MTMRDRNDLFDARLQRFLTRQADEAAATALPVEDVADRLVGALERRQPQPLRRFIWLLAVLAMLSAALATAIVLGSYEERLTPAEIVIWSQGVSRDPPAFAMTVRFENGNEARYLYDGVATLRIEATVGAYELGGPVAEGGYLLFDGERSGKYNPLDLSWGAGELPLDWRVQVRPTWFPIEGMLMPGDPAWRGFASCSDWLAGGEDIIIGRGADVIVCGPVTYWVDRETGFLLRVDDPRDTWTPDPTVVSLETGVALPPELFLFDPPPEAVSSDRVSFLFDVGDPAPPWTAPLVAGGIFDSRSLADRPAAILFSSPPCCEGDPGLSLLTALDSYVREHPGALGAVVVAVPGLRDEVVEMASEAGVNLPIAFDTESEVWQAWGLRFAPLVLLSADGRIAVFWYRELSSEELARMVEAIESGSPVPTPAGY